MLSALRRCGALGLGLWVLSGCGSTVPTGASGGDPGAASASALASRLPASTTPVLLIHGIYDTNAKMVPMDNYLAAHGFQQHYRMDLVPSDGTVPLETLAGQVSQKVREIQAQTGAPSVDIVAFSMGGVVSRYYLQEMGGLAHTRRFVTISSPHHGTDTAFVNNNPGVLEMRPNSAYLDALNADTGALGLHHCTSLWTPLDLMIVPSNSSVVPWAKNVSFPVALHPLMVSDSRVLAAVAKALTEPDSDWVGGDRLLGGLLAGS